MSVFIRKNSCLHSKPVAPKSLRQKNNNALPFLKFCIYIWTNGTGYLFMAQKKKKSISFSLQASYKYNIFLCLAIIVLTSGNQFYFWRDRTQFIYLSSICWKKNFQPNVSKSILCQAFEFRILILFP